MKKLLAVVLLCSIGIAHADVKIKKVCHDVRIKGKMVHQCKNIKIHRKFEGIPIPDKK
jgi:hypothetical protein